MNLDKFPNFEEFKKQFAENSVGVVCSEFLADMETPVSLFAKLYDAYEGRIFLLESVEGGDRWGKYSFIGVGVHKKVEVFAEDVVITGSQGRQKINHEGRPFDVLRRISSEYNLARISRIERMPAGLVGYMNYEMVSFFEKIPNKLGKDESIACFVIPEVIISFDNSKHTSVCAALAFKEEVSDPQKAYQQASEKVFSVRQMLQTPAVSTIAKDHGDFSVKPTCGKEEFMEKVENVKEHIAEGDIIQAVISHPFICDHRVSPLSLYRAQRYINPSPYMFFIDIDDRTLVGSSPETMVRLESDKAFLKPIAGTRKRGASQQEDRKLADELLKDEKERAEHLMLVDLGRNDLGRIAQTGTVQVTDLMIVERYSHVMHLVSNVECNIRQQKDCFDLIQAAFPAGTLSGAPKVRAMEIIGEMEEQPRGPYGGCAGYISFNGDMDMAITIRTAVVEKNKVTVQAGAGIVADSDPESEYIETVNKSMSIQRALTFIEEVMLPGSH
ncbi:Anthranilate synthase component 1 [Sedimentisphaera cyanobacteriorum]|uniref:Anthranilate synthase component 1 n=1 Tax=Sedimentisphaera cyanobacteriorum TaxID=1940790 RepID=A0A1Q2HMD8_9BACT|nr:anthranilate synthase component I family protein [Sedimentisphaera cyanobacteriorum]AQQ08435.1 Anthranilate synthase component 1 [Sedimentisphaera cyanobacteriorum]